MIKRLVYIANARFPTEKAHGYQICKMSEAFVQCGVRVLLLHPYRRQLNATLQRQSVFDYYDLPEVFEVRTLSNFDVLLIEHLLPKSIFTPVFWIHALLWGGYAALVARREKADLYYTRDSAVAYWLLRLGLPTAYEVHEVPKRAQRQLLRRMARYPALQLVVVKTSFIKERFVEMGFAVEKLTVLPNGIDLSLSEDLPSREECREGFGLPQDRFIIGYIGRFQTLGMEKGIPELIQAMRHLLAFKGKVPLLLCVGGPMDVVPAYLNLARHWSVPEQHLRFVDRVPNREVPLWIRTFDIAVAPFPVNEHYSYFMSPLKIFEYMAAGVPILATNLPSIRELLRHGENAWLVEPAKPLALAKGVMTIANDASLSRKLSAHAKELAKSYSWENRVQILLDSLNKNHPL